MARGNLWDPHRQGAEIGLDGDLPPLRLVQKHRNLREWRIAGAPRGNGRSASQQERRRHASCTGTCGRRNHPTDSWGMAEKEGCESRHNGCRPSTQDSSRHPQLQAQEKTLSRTRSRVELPKCRPDISRAGRCDGSILAGGLWQQGALSSM